MRASAWGLAGARAAARPASRGCRCPRQRLEAAAPAAGPAATGVPAARTASAGPAAARTTCPRRLVAAPASPGRGSGPAGPRPVRSELSKQAGCWPVGPEAGDPGRNKGWFRTLVPSFALPRLASACLHPPRAPQCAAVRPRGSTLCVRKSKHGDRGRDGENRISLAHGPHGAA